MCVLQTIPVEQSAFVVQDTQAPRRQCGVEPLQSALERHSTQMPASTLHIGTPVSAHWDWVEQWRTGGAVGPPSSPVAAEASASVKSRDRSRHPACMSASDAIESPSSRLGARSMASSYQPTARLLASSRAKPSG
jgi:hypothetical protein